MLETFLHPISRLLLSPCVGGACPERECPYWWFERCKRSNQHKRKDEDDFKFPPLRKTARKTTLEQPTDLNLENQFSLLPNVITKQVSGQLTPPITNTTPPVSPNQQPRQGNNALPLPTMLKVTKQFRIQIDTIKKYTHT
ncbi:hypothetical protein TNCV_1238671 [Trichonephila clavipes]|nr:hypothetical protein TNCV_1238671 [Trichonephila clavipes]